MSDIETLSRQALADIASAETPDALEVLRVALLGKHGSITAQLKALGSLPADQRKAAGEAINRARDALGDALASRKVALENAVLDARLATETIDITLPGRDATRGGLHPVSRTMERIAGIFGRLGYARAEGPERARTHLPLEPLHRRHRDEDERHGPADPDDRREQVHDAEERVDHLGSFPKRPCGRPAMLRRRVAATLRAWSSSPSR